MNTVKRTSEELLDLLAQALIEEGMTADELDIDAMSFAEMEQLGHRVGKQLARRVQQDLAERQADRMNQQSGAQYACPGCGRSSRAEPGSRTVQTVDGDVEFAEPKCFCKSCRKSFFPSA